MKTLLIAMDLDGTLLSEDHETISARNREALRAASERGVKIVIASGRTRGVMGSVYAQLPFADYAVTSNGAAVYDLKTGDRVCYQGIPYEKWCKVYDIFRRHGSVFEVYADGRAHMERRLFVHYENDLLPRDFVENLKKSIVPVENAREYLKGKSIEKICALTTDPVEYPQALAELNALPGLCLTSSIPGNVEINEAGTNKGSALAALCETLGIPQEAVMAFGDAGNDVEMLTFAGQSYSMENGTPEAKAAAKAVTRSNAEDGVAAAVEQIL